MGKETKQDETEKQQGDFRKFARWLLIPFLVIVAYMFFLPGVVDYKAVEIPYSEFKSLLQSDAVAELELRGKVARGRLQSPQPIGSEDQTSEHFRTRIPEFGDESLLPALEAGEVEVSVKEPQKTNGWLLSLVPWLLLLVFFLWMMRRAARNVGGFGGPGAMQEFLKGGEKTGEVPKVSFTDVAGQQNAKREVQELIDFLGNPKRYATLGAEPPRGVLLMGPPGTGKTLLARALAGEAGVPFYSISASEFIELFVGVGASRVRNLFKAAKKDAPSIVFIDELDSVGRTRGTGLGGGHDEREQTLNQILAEMDGFSGHEAVIVLAATNRPDVLDPALLRPGRFDRHVTLDLPDRSDRLAILKVHTRKVPLADDTDLEQIASGTPGFSGADLKNLVNEAAILAARERGTAVTMKHLDEARDKLILGTERTLAIQPEERHRLAVHECGHTLVAYFLHHTDPLYKVTIIPRGRALGGMQQVPEEERHTLPEEYLKDRLAVILGGRTAEKELLGSMSSGADDDIRQATQLARAMVSRWGMSEEVGPVDLRDSEDHPFLGKEIAQPRRFSESSAREVDDAVRRLLLDAEESATQVIGGHRAALDRLVSQLESEETLYKDQIEECLRGQPQEEPPAGTNVPPQEVK